MHLQNTLAWLLFTLILPIVILVCVPLRIYKTIVILLYGSQPLNSYDSIFAIDDLSRPYAANLSYIVLDKSLGIEYLRSKFNVGDSRLSKLPVNYLGFYFWKEVGMEPSKHIRLGHDFSASDMSLSEVIGSLMSSPFLAGTSPWELLLLENYEQGCVIVLRLHHVLGDGYGANMLIDGLMGVRSEYLVKVEQEKSWGEVATLIYSAPARLFQLYLSAFTASDSFTIRKSSSKILVSMTTLDLQKLKHLRRQLNIHFASLCMSLVIGALRKHVKKHSSHISVMHSLPKANHPMTLVNHWAVGIFKVPFKEACPMKRAVQTEQGYEEYVGAGYREIIHYHMPLFGLLPSFFVRTFFSVNFGTGMGFTSVPGYGMRGFVGGAGVTGMWKVFGMQWSQTAIASAVYTSNNALGLTISANVDVVPNQADLDLITQVYVKEELDALCFRMMNNNSS